MDDLRRMGRGELVEIIYQLRRALDEKDAALADCRKRLAEKRALDEQNALIRQNSAYGRIVCRCESITEGEIVDAICRPVGARSLDGVKRRVRAGMGRCQGGFCSTRVMEILARELKTSLADITKSGGEAKLITGLAKQEAEKYETI